MLRRIALILLILLTLTTGIALAKVTGPPPKITISGPSLDGEIEITNPVWLQHLGDDFVLDCHLQLPAPDNPGPGYEITRYYQDGYGVIHALDRLRYHLNPSGGHGYIFYIGPVGGFSGIDRTWCYPSEEGDATMREIIANYSVQPSSPIQLPSTIEPFAWLSLLAALALGLAYRQRTRIS